MKFYDDDTGTGRGVISHPTALHFALTQSINPSTSIIMTMSQSTGVFVNGNFSAQNIYNKTDVDNGLNLNIGGSGTAYYLPKFTDTRVMANSGIQENALAQIGIGGTLDIYFKLRITGDVYVNDTISGNGIALASQLDNCSLISRQMNNFTSGRNTYIGRWGLFMEPKRVVLSVSRDGLKFWPRVYWRISGKRHQAIKPHGQ